MQTKILQTLAWPRSGLLIRSHALRGLWLRALLLASVFGIHFTRAAQQVEIYGLSLRFHNSTAVQAGLTWRLDLTSGSQNVPANGELALADGANDYTHSGFFFLFNPVLSRTDYLPMSLNIPTADSDRNG